MIVIRRSNRHPDAVQQDMERLFRALIPTRSPLTAARSGSWRPPVEVIETSDALVVSVEIAGIDPTGVDVTASDQLLTIRGERRNPGHGIERTYHEAGVAYGRFAADVYLPWPADVDSADATYQDGFLRIHIPRLAARRIALRRIEPARRDEAIPEETK